MWKAVISSPFWYNQAMNKDVFKTESASFAAAISKVEYERLVGLPSYQHKGYAPDWSAAVLRTYMGTMYRNAPFG